MELDRGLSRLSTYRAVDACRLASHFDTFFVAKITASDGKQSEPSALVLYAIYVLYLLSTTAIIAAILDILQYSLRFHINFGDASIRRSM